MFLINEKTCRPRGRPRIRPDSETLRLMVEAAEQEFQANGYAGTSMLDVARHAGVSTKTMYRLISTKAELFREVVSRRIGRFMLAFAAEAHDAAGLRQALVHLLIAYGDLSLSKEAVAIHRLVLAECRRFPELAELFHAEAIRGTGEAMASWLWRHRERGLLRLEDPALAAGMLRGMMAMEPQRAVMLDRRAPPDAEDLAERAGYCADLFLDGCGK
ncbi:MAG TPA: TetR/AcrR family transcriptional regulator [Magnetospirillaceae bacterium]|nr:TetR/AcrR family transcriptional regulator [Magnetospirillaceae bacterium]